MPIVAPVPLKFRSSMRSLEPTALTSTLEDPSDSSDLLVGACVPPSVGGGLEANCCSPVPRAELHLFDPLLPFPST